MRPLAIVALTFVVHATIRAADRPAPFALAVMRRDGILIPFAEFDGKRWFTSWPRAGADLPIPINLISVPKSWWGPAKSAEQWRVFTPDGEQATARVTQPDWIRAHCVHQIALRTDYRSTQPAVPPSEQPYPKDGLAVSGSQQIEKIERLDEISNEVFELRAVLRDHFNKAENETAARFGHPIKAQARNAIEPTIEAAYAFGRYPRVYYVEAARGYQIDGEREDRCTMAFGTGWFLRDQGNVLRNLDMAVDLLPCTRNGATYMLPLGAVRVGTRTFWVVQYSTWNHERYVVAEIVKNRVEAAVVKGGGGC